MAKKTNKTNHVLNLLSGADEQDAEVQKAAEETEPKIQIVNQNQEDSIAADVQQMLEEELLQEEQALQAQREKETEWQTEAAAADAAASVPAAEPTSASVSDAEPIAVPAASAADHAETAAPADTSATEAEPDSAEIAAQTAEPESAAGEAGVSAEAAAAETAASETDMNTEEADAAETDTTPAEAAASGTDANTAADAASEVDRNTAEAATASAASAAETAHETPVSDAGQPQAAPAARGRSAQVYLYGLPAPRAACRPPARPALSPSGGRSRPLFGAALPVGRPHSLGRGTHGAAVDTLLHGGRPSVAPPAGFIGSSGSADSLRPAATGRAVRRGGRVSRRRV